MYDVFKTINDKYYKRHQRGKGFKLIGIRSLECTFNPISREYHPHFHLIVADEQMANVIMQDWLYAWGVHEASGSA
jgi:plasmid rolling circle replication initiator protein Rep